MVYLLVWAGTDIRDLLGLGLLELSINYSSNLDFL